MTKLPRHHWIHFYRVVRKQGLAERYGFRAGLGDPLVAKARTIARLEELAQDGLVGFATDSMDCDCVRMSACRAIPASWYGLQARIEALYEGAEGPTSWWLCEPPARPEYSSRDLALEAFENGHPHVVYY